MFCAPDNLKKIFCSCRVKTVTNKTFKWIHDKYISFKCKVACRHLLLPEQHESDNRLEISYFQCFNGF